jgi:hypothetical protein
LYKEREEDFGKDSPSGRCLPMDRFVAGLQELKRHVCIPTENLAPLGIAKDSVQFQQCVVR